MLRWTTKKDREYARKFKNRSNNNYDEEAYSRTPNLYITSKVFEEIKMSRKPNVCWERTQKVKQFSEHLQELKRCNSRNSLRGRKWWKQIEESTQIFSKKKKYPRANWSEESWKPNYSRLRNHGGDHMSQIKKFGYFVG